MQLIISPTYSNNSRGNHLLTSTSKQPVPVKCTVAAFRQPVSCPPTNYYFVPTEQIHPFRPPPVICICALSLARSLTSIKSNPAFAPGRITRYRPLYRYWVDAISCCFASAWSDARPSLAPRNLTAIFPCVASPPAQDPFGHCQLIAIMAANSSYFAGKRPPIPNLQP